MRKSITFNKHRANRIHKALQSNRPISPFGETWTYEDIVHLVSVSTAELFTQLCQRLGKGLPQEERKALFDEINRDFPFILHHLTDVALYLPGNNFNDRYADKVVVVVDNKRIEPISGIKQRTQT